MKRRIESIGCAALLGPLACTVEVTGTHPEGELGRAEQPLMATACNDNVARAADPFESDPGWGGGALPGDIVDGEIAYPDWARGLAFTGGPRSWMGALCGLRQATVDWGTPRRVGRALVWHHGTQADHVPRTYWLEYFEDGAWHPVTNESKSVRPELDSSTAGLAGAIPTEHFFDPVETQKLRFVMDNCDLPADSDGHGWLYEFQVFSCADELTITALSLHDIDRQPLAHLSTDNHTYFRGRTRVHGTVRVEGPPGETLESLTLSVREGDRAIATAELARAAGQRLLGIFPSSGELTLTQSQLLFELPASELSQVDRDHDGPLALSVLARLANGAESEPFVRDGIDKLVAFNPVRRYGDADPSAGGDVWVKPSARDAFVRIERRFPQLYWGDGANMNGGPFPPHEGNGHQDGTAADAWHTSYAVLARPGVPPRLLPWTRPGAVSRWREREEAAARFLIRLLTSEAEIDHIYVSPTPYHFAFWNVIDRSGYADRITAFRGHETHFHIDLKRH